MAYFSLQCVACSDQTKRCAGEYSGKDEDGQPFCGQMYLCGNSTCKINVERVRAEKQFHKYMMQDNVLNYRYG